MLPDIYYLVVTPAAKVTIVLDRDEAFDVAVCGDEGSHVLCICKDAAPTQVTFNDEGDAQVLEIPYHAK